MSNSIRLEITGEPQGQPRPRARAFEAGGVITARVYQPERQRGKDGKVRDLPITTWRRRVADEVRRCLPPEPWTGPVKLDVVFYFERTQELMRPKHSAGLIPHTVKPDVDNAVKAIMDELVEKRTKRVVVRRGILRDDSCVCELHVRKWWCERGAEAGAVVTVSRIGAAAPALPFVEPKRTHVGGYKLAEPIINGESRGAGNG